MSSKIRDINFNIADPDHYTDRNSNDLRETSQFDDYKQSVLDFIQETCAERATPETAGFCKWSDLSNHFPGEHYYFGLAVEALDGKEIIVQKHLIPERIVINTTKRAAAEIRKRTALRVVDNPRKVFPERI